MNGNDLEEADNIMRLAFGTFLGLPEPIRFMGDADYVKTRYNANPLAALVAITKDNRIVGSNFAIDWGSVGIFGPLTVHPNYWDKGVARELLGETMKIFERWGTKHLGLFTFAQSSKHVHLYQKFGFWPRYLTAVMSKQISNDKGEEHSPPKSTNLIKYSQLDSTERQNALKDNRQLTNAIYTGLDLGTEINSVHRQGLGDTLLLRDKSDNGLLGVAICHAGPNTEAGSGNCYIKFGAAKPSGNSAMVFRELLDASVEFAKSRNMTQLVGGANTGRHNAYRIMIEQGFRTDMQGIAMHRPNESGYNVPEVYVIDDWR